MNRQQSTLTIRPSQSSEMSPSDALLTTPVLPPGSAVIVQLPFTGKLTVARVALTELTWTETGFAVWYRVGAVFAHDNDDDSEFGTICNVPPDRLTPAPFIKWAGSELGHQMG